MTREQLGIYLIIKGLDQLQQKAALMAIESTPGQPQPVYFPRTGDTGTFSWDGFATYSEVNE